MTLGSQSAEMTYAFFINPTAGERATFAALASARSLIGSPVEVRRRIDRQGLIHALWVAFELQSTG